MVSIADMFLQAASTRYMTDVPTPSVRPIFRMPMPSVRRARIRASTSGLTGTAAQRDALRLGPRKASVDPLTDHLPFEFGEDTAHLNHGTTGRRRGVERLLVELQVTAHRLQFTGEADEVLKTAAEPVDAPCRDHVDLARCGIHSQPIEAGTLVAPFGAADAGILIDTDDLPAGPRGNGRNWNFSWAIRDCAANMLRITRGRGKPQLVRQMQNYRRKVSGTTRNFALRTRRTNPATAGVIYSEIDDVAHREPPALGVARRVPSVSPPAVLRRAAGVRRRGGRSDTDVFIGGVLCTLSGLVIGLRLLWWLGLEPGQKSQLFLGLLFVYTNNHGQAIKNCTQKIPRSTGWD
jgi:hypothetical protein